MNYILLFTTLIATVGGQMILKFGQSTLYLPKAVNLMEAKRFLFESILNKYTISSILFTSIGILTWLMVIQRMKLSVAYPFMSLSYVIVFFLSYFVFKEEITLYQLLGIVCIMSGVVLITWK